MLDSIAINLHASSRKNQRFTIGHLAECLLFYGKVDAVISRIELEEIIRKCSVEHLVELLSSGALSLHINLEFFGSNQTPRTARLNYAIYKVVNHNVETTLYKALYGVYRSAYKCSQYVKQLMPFLNEYKYEFDLVGGFLIDEQFTSKAFREVVRSVYEEYPIPTDLKFQLHPVPKSTAIEEIGTQFTFETETNFDLSQFEKHLEKSGIKGYKDFGVNFMMRASAAIQDVDVSSYFKSELSAEESNASIVQKAILNLDQYQANNGEVITEFHQFVIPECPSIADAIDLGMKTFADFMHLYRHAQQFRKWLSEMPDDGDHSIINEYIKFVEMTPFTNSSLFKWLKLIFVSAPIAINPINLAGQPDLVNNIVNFLAGTAADQYVDLLAQRFNHWRPNQFVQGPLKNFLKKEESS
ncbi:hypothetical protein [Spirosoma endophyticum]|uniref:Uncharacterized protein n=1 Tax=Spirosoma endophyticum TaxID=662367 RepID=A0A1I2B8Y2_9BACT|nr:hypothetical protein [Spirosoma endophyticum]SFE52447.1 hypothetical protein SAMN05216167_11523 [Spirosoma endophyticum]